MVSTRCLSILGYRVTETHVSRAESWQFLVDMDGVLVDFVRPALALHGREEVLADWPAGEWDMPGILGISSEEFWRPIHAVGARFWAELEPFVWCDPLLELVRSRGRFAILTSPSHDAGCAAGKITWLQSRLGYDFRDFLIGPPKWLCARPGQLLIDDNDTNVERFRERGGEAILFPQPWNRNHALAGSDPIEYINEQLEQLSLP